jgi:hypothetical protein
VALQVQRGHGCVCTLPPMLPCSDARVLCEPRLSAALFDPLLLQQSCARGTQAARSRCSMHRPAHDTAHATAQTVNCGRLAVLTFAKLILLSGCVGRFTGAVLHLVYHFRTRKTPSTLLSFEDTATSPQHPCSVVPRVPRLHCSRQRRAGSGLVRTGKT